MLAMVETAAREHGVRAIVGAGWSRLPAAQGLGDHVRIVGAVDHGWLLPQCRAAEPDAAPAIVERIEALSEIRVRAR